MEALLGKVNGIDGIFFAKDADGNVVELKNGDEITQGMIVYGDPSNSSSAMITVAMVDTGELVNLAGTSEQLFDGSLINEDELDGALAEESVDGADGILAALDDETNADKDEEVVDEETAAGEEDVAGGGDSAGVFAARDGSATDISAGLRDTTFTDTTATTTEDQILLTNAIVTLETVDVNEDTGIVTFTATLSNAGVAPVIVTTEHGDIIIAAGDTTGTITVDMTDPDVYIDPTSVSATVLGATGGGFYTIDYTDATATAQVADTIDTTIVTLETSNVNEDTGLVTFTATLSNPGQTAVTVTTDLGDINFAAGQTVGTITVDMTDPDVYVDPTSVAATVTAVTGGNFEAVDFSGATATANVTDTTNDTTATITTADVNEDNVTGAVFNISLDNDPQNADGTPSTATATVEVKDADGALVSTETVTIDGNGDGSFTINTQDSDVYLDGQSYTATITDVTGGNYENVVHTDTATANVTDIIDPVTATLTADVNEISEDGGSIVYTVTLTGSPGSIDPDTNLIFNLANGEEVTILAGDTSGSVTKTYTDAEITNQANIANSFDSTTPVKSGGTEYENLVTTGETDIDIDYTPTIASTDVIVDEDDLVLGSDTTKEATSVSGTITVSSADGIESLTIGGIDVITDNVVSLGHVTTVLNNDLSLDSYNPVTGILSYTYTLVANQAHPDGNADNTLSDNVEIVLIDQDTNNPDTVTSSLSVTIIDDVPTIAVEDIDVYRQVGVSNGDITFNSGADAVTLTEFMKNDGVLSWDNMDSSKYSFDFKSSTDTSETYDATYVDVNGDTQTYFEVTVKDDGTYDFDLLNPAPSIVTSSEQLFGSINDPVDTDGDGKADTAVIDSSNFGGAFSVAITGSDDGGTTYGGDVVISKSATDIGVDGNSLQENQDESMRFTINREVGHSNTTLDTMTINASETGSFATNSNVSLIVTYTNGSTDLITLSAPAAVDTDGDGNTDAHVLVFDIDSTKLVDYVDLAPADNNLTMKIVGVSMEYTTVVDPADQLLNFTIKGEDSDVDAATAGFSINIMSGTDGDDTITTAAGADNVSAGAGDDTIAYDPDDTVDGGIGFDTLTIDGNISVDFSNENIQNIENISLVSGSAQNLTLSLDDVLFMTDDNNTISITDDAANSLTISKGTTDTDGDGLEDVTITNNGWTEASISDTNFSDGKEYTNSDGDSVTLTVDETTYDIV